MPTSEEINAQHEQLAAYRHTLSILLVQQAQLGAAHAPPGVINGIHEARDGIRRCKNTLRSWGVSVENHPDDESASWPGIRPPQLVPTQSTPPPFIGNPRLDNSDYTPSGVSTEELMATLSWTPAKSNQAATRGSVLDSGLAQSDTLLPIVVFPAEYHLKGDFLIICLVASAIVLLIGLLPLMTSVAALIQGSDPDSASWPFCVIFIVGGLFLLSRTYQSRHCRVWLSTTGLVSNINLTGRSIRLDWKQIKELEVIPPPESGTIVTIVVRSNKYVVRGLSGATISFGWALENSDVLALQIQHTLENYLLPGAISDYNAGRSITFGKYDHIILSKAGLKLNQLRIDLASSSQNANTFGQGGGLIGQTLNSFGLPLSENIIPWDHVNQVLPDGPQLWLIRRDSMERHSLGHIENIPNHFILQALVDYILHGPPRSGHLE